MAATTNLATTLCNTFKYPIIVILGSTGVGKTKLSIELAKKVDGEIISADSMQVYKGLDVVTAKATHAERAEIKHHMIDIVNPLDSFSVVEFRNMALPIISDISSKGKVPIIVGGTNYYIESLLWNILVTEDSGNQKTLASDLEDTCPNLSKIDFEILKDQSTYSFLQSIDPVAASRVHPNDSRKVKRKLDIWKTTGKKPSDVIVEQQSFNGGDHLGGPLRFTNSLVFWLSCEQTALDKRICDRVESMLANGLVEEISGFYDDYNSKILTKTPSFIPYKEGIFQAIGFKEFHNFLTSKFDNDNKKEELFKESIETLKRVTIRYSKKQNTWIRNRFLKRPIHSSPNVYKLDASVIEQWNETALQPTLDAATLFLSGKKIQLLPMPRLFKDQAEDQHKQYFCETCNGKLIVGDSVWKQHCQSRKHKKRSAKRKKLEALDVKTV